MAVRRTASVAVALCTEAADRPRPAFYFPVTTAMHTLLRVSFVRSLRTDADDFAIWSSRRTAVHDYSAK